MGDKLVAGIVTAVVIAPFCALCILGPAVFASIFAGIAGWFGGLGPVLTIGLVLVAGIIVYTKTRRRMARRTPLTPGGEARDER
jgi:membrane protein implicated in regulation of membrane protease activity